MAISQNTALFSLIGTFYGGNGTSTFQLPDLRSRVAVGQGQGPGLSQYVIGEAIGTENVTLNLNEIPLHTHVAGCYDHAGDSYSGTNGIPAIDAGGNNLYSAPQDKTMAANELPPAGGSQPHTNIQPYLALNYCIALLGIFPARN